MRGKSVLHPRLKRAPGYTQTNQPTVIDNIQREMNRIVTHDRFSFVFSFAMYEAIKLSQQKHNKIISDRTS